MAKINILTFVKVKNFGAVMQAYALKTFLQNNGHDVKFVDYSPDFINLNFELSKHPLRCIKSFVSYKQFKTFINTEFSFSQTFNSKKELEESEIDSDIFIVGSDQVWNSTTVNGFNDAYFLSFVKKGKKVAYAASMGSTPIAENMQSTVKDLLNDFSYISVRESFAQNELEKKLNINSDVVLDPTFLINDYSSIINTNSQYKNNVICYFVRSNEENVRVCKAYVDYYKTPLLNISATIAKHTKNTLQLSPSDWVSYIKGAKHVVTNSFHGVALSIIFNRNFVFIPNKEQNHNNRVSDLLTQLDLADRILLDRKDLDKTLSQTIDYKSVNEKLDMLRSYSISRIYQFTN